MAAVVKGKDTLLLKAYGKADLEGAVPLTVDTVAIVAIETLTIFGPPFWRRFS